MTTTNTPDPADSHQAGEYDVLVECREILTWLVTARNQDSAIEQAVIWLYGWHKKLIRTEQKKLLAAVGERVIGEDYPAHVHNIKGFQATQRIKLQQVMEEL